MTMITVKPLRDEALTVGFEALKPRIPESLSFDQFCKNLAAWEISAFCDGDKPVGMLMVKENELHVAVLPEVRGRWLSRRLIKQVFAPIIREYGKAKTSVMPDNAVGRDFVQRIRDGFVSLEFDPMTAAIAIGGSAITGMMGANAAEDAASQQAAASDRSAATQLQMFNTINQQQAPYRQAGQNALGALQSGLSLTPAQGPVADYFTKQFGANDLNANLAPNWKFQLDQGLGAIKNQASVGSGMLSGNTLRGINDYAQNFAGNAYQQAYNNFTANQSNIFNRLSTIAGLGSASNQQSAQAATAAGQGIGAAQQAAGAAQAAGTVGSANAMTGGLNNAMGWYQLSKLVG